MEAPHGVLGVITGSVMARLTAEANRWVVDLLDVRPDDRVLDVGCGPGVAVALAAARARQGLVVGIDRSPAMVRQARVRNRSGIRQGNVHIRHGHAGALPFGDGRFTKAVSVNSLQLWPSPEAGLRDLHRVLEPGGRAVVVLMARSDDAPASDPEAIPEPPSWIGALARTLTGAGFGDVTVQGRAFGGVWHWALLTHR
jgi:ubiquinone/menaquinone biosynthesis C-methylase UbiE